MKKREMTEDEQAVVAELERARSVLRLQDKAFHHAFLPGDYWTWINARTMGVSERVIHGYRVALTEVREAVLRAGAVWQRGSKPCPVEDFVATRSTRLVESALRAALRGDPDVVGRSGGKQRRIILVLGVTDSGKSALRDHLAVTYGGVIVRATESCRTNATAIHCEIQRALGETRDWRSRAAREQATFRMLATPGAEGPQVVLYDESLRLGPSACNVLCDINDMTAAVQVVFGLPELIDRLAGRGWAESSQLMSRVLETVELAQLRPEDVRPLLAGCGLNGSTDVVAAELAAAANEYGRFGFVRRVVGAIRRQKAHTIEQICGDLRKPAEARTGIIPDEREALRIQRMTERLREAQEKRGRTRNLRYADRHAVKAGAA